MTDRELKDYLKQYLEYADGVRNYVRALEYYKTHSVSQLIDGRLYRETVRQIDHAIMLARDELTMKTATVKAWSYLIDDEDRQQIFIERYLNGDHWEDIINRHCYSQSQIFKINNYCCDEIARKTVCDLTASHDTKPEALSQ